MDSRNFVYTPLWVRVVSITALVLTLVTSLVVTWFYINTNKETWLLVAMSLAQVSASGLAFALVVFYSSRDAGVAGLQQKTNAFLCDLLPRNLLFIEFPDADMVDWREAGIGKRQIDRDLSRSPTKIRLQKVSGDNAALYKVTAFGDELTLRVQVNVWEVTVSYFFPAGSEAEIDGLTEKLAWALSRFTDVVGYKESWYFSKERFDRQTYVSVHLTKNFDTDFLDDDRQKLNFAQDLAASSRSLIKECQTRGIALRH